jgi:hypothetical protein
MKESMNAHDLWSLAGAFSALAARMKPREAAAACGQAAATLIQAMKKAKNQYDLKNQVYGLSGLLTRMEPREAASVCSQAVVLLSDKELDQGTATDLLLNLLGDADWGPWGSTYMVSVAGIGTTPQSSLIVVGVIPRVFLIRAPRMPAKALVDLLKQPLWCNGDARRVVLRQLGLHYQRSFADQWEFVRFAKKRKLDLDLTTPPKRPVPKRPVSGAAKH